MWINQYILIPITELKSLKQRQQNLREGAGLELIWDSHNYQSFPDSDVDWLLCCFYWAIKKKKKTAHSVCVQMSYRLADL